MASEESPAQDNSLLQAKSTNNGEGESDRTDDVTNVYYTENGVMNGSELSVEEFRCPSGKSVSVIPIIVDFRRLLQCTDSLSLVEGIPNRELLHSTIALYDTSLSEMTPDCLYSTVCDKEARTMLLLRSLKDAEEDHYYLKKESKDEENKPEEMIVTEELLNKLDIDLSTCDDYFKEINEPPPKFHEVFSDTDDNSNEEEDSDIEYTKGIETFIDKVKARRFVKKCCQLQKYKPNRDSSTIYGAESRIIAAATYSKTKVKSDRVVHLTLIATRKRFRKCGMGKYLVNALKDRNVVGNYDAVVVHADHSAVDFFSRYSFSDDLLLNSRWSEIAESFTNCSLMCYLPPFTTQTLTENSVPELDIIAMEKEMKKWRDKTLDAYRAEVSVVERMRHEMIHLRALVASQQNLISNLAADNAELRKAKYETEREFLEYKIMSAKTFQSDQDEDEDEELAELIKKLEKEANLKKLTPSAAGGKSYSKLDAEGKRKYMFNAGDSSDPYDHGKDTEEFFKVSKDFYDSMRLDHHFTTVYEVKLVTKAILTTTQEESYQLSLQALKEPSMVTRLYFCGTLNNPKRIPDILKKGFSEEDFSQGDYGQGLHFSQLPSKAAQFSALGKIILAEVGIGNTETVVEKNCSRKRPSDGFDAIITPGRLTPDSSDEAQSCQEYVIFNPNQVKPLYLIEFSPKAS